MPPQRSKQLAQQPLDQRAKPAMISVHDQFMAACVQLNEPRLRQLVGRVRLIGSWLTVNQQDATGRTPLSHLSGHGSGGCVREFSRLKLADVNMADRDGNTPLHYAAQAGHADVVAALLTKFEGIAVDANNRLGITPLMKACTRGQQLCAKLILDQGGDPAAADPRRRLSADQWASLCGWPACARLLHCHRLLAELRRPAPASSRRRRRGSESDAADSGGGDRRHERRASLPAGMRRCAGPPPLFRPVPAVRVCVVEPAEEPTVARYGDPRVPPQSIRHNQVAALCVPGMGKDFAYE